MNTGIQAPENIPAVVLAAGKGTRMKARSPKATVSLGGKPMAARVIDSLRAAGITRIIAVVGHRAAEVRDAIGNHVEYVFQGQQLGTGHAASCAEPCLTGYEGPIVIAYADIPLLGHGDFTDLISHHLRTGAPATILTSILEDAGTLGRIVRGPDRGVRGIVEARDATADQSRIREINVGVYCFAAPLVFQVLGEVSNENAQAQYYLTDAIGKLVRRGKRVEALSLNRPHAGMGVDTVEDLSRAAHLLREPDLSSSARLRGAEANAS